MASLSGAEVLRSCNEAAAGTIEIPESATWREEKSTKLAKAVWLSRSIIKWPEAPKQGMFRLYFSAGAQLEISLGSRVRGADGFVALETSETNLPERLEEGARHLADGALLRVSDSDAALLPNVLKSQFVIVREDIDGRVIDVTRTQIARALDDIYASAEDIDDFGVSIEQGRSTFRVWSPTATALSICVYRTGHSKAFAQYPLDWDPKTGGWHISVPKDLTGHYYTFRARLYVPGYGVVVNRVTDPYSISLNANSTRSYVASLSDKTLRPEGWGRIPSPKPLASQTDMTIYELHVRDFSVNDASVSLPHRGKYLAFTSRTSQGIKHLTALAKAGVTDVHLLPVFDIATIPEVGCISPRIGRASPASEAPQARIAQVAEKDCFNWGYDPFHFTAPEGSYASSAGDGAARILEFRQMVQSLHRIGLRVGMDVVYNHTAASGQHQKSVLDRIVPGYYHRLNENGEVERSTCCENTATEHRMMAKLMADSVVTWARHYAIDSFRFDLMGHQPREAMLKLQARLTKETGRQIPLIGEGWNFGEVLNGRRFIQASQLSLNGTNIATFSDRARDAIRGGGATDGGEKLVSAVGFVNGIAASNDRALQGRSADLVRVGLAGSIRSYQLLTYNGELRRLEQINYADQPAGYVSEPAEVVNYVENHDNHTLFDINAFKLPPMMGPDERARVQVLALALNSFSQGIAYFHAGGELLRSKSLDKNSFDSGDWFNRIDWSGRDNYFGTGLPPRKDNAGDYVYIQPRLNQPMIKPTAREIGWTKRAFLDLLTIRSSSTLFRLRDAEAIRSRLVFYNVGAEQKSGLIAAHLDGRGYPGAAFDDVAYFVNVNDNAVDVRISTLADRRIQLHPVHLRPDAADTRVRLEARVDAINGIFTIPARSAVVWVVPQ
ncbi:MAG: DUF3372 domain-containing protein [Rhodocyclaceae bacterium]|nr:DUF3372 domain-containing protein [Rhodocyclaceae bacterium]